MTLFEHDYSDHTQSPDFRHGDERPCNTSGNPTFYAVIEARTTRRSFLLSSLAALATELHGPKAIASQIQSHSRGLLGFSAVAVNRDDKVVVPPGYKVQVLAPWGSPINGMSPPTGRARSLRPTRLCRSGAIMTASISFR